MNILKVTEQNLQAEIKKSIECGLHRVLCVVVGSPIVGVHKYTQVDPGVCKDLGYDVCEAYYNGGTLVANKGDIAFAHFGEVKNDWMERFIKHFTSWLRAKGLNAEHTGNDILVDGYKVCGTGITRYGRIDFSAVFVSINPNLEHIKAICKKPMNKVPKGLSEFGITTEEVEEMFLGFCAKEHLVHK